MIAHIKRILKVGTVILGSSLVVACAHPIMINPTESIANEKSFSDKNVAYVLTDEQRNLKVITPGGGGDKVEYQPYRDLEKAIRDALKSVYDDVFVLNSSVDRKSIIDNKIKFIFTPEITTDSSSGSIFTWPPTRFEIVLNCSVVNEKGEKISDFVITANGASEFSEFKSDFGLAGRRAADDLSAKLRSKLLSDEKLL